MGYGGRITRLSEFWGRLWDKDIPELDTISPLKGSNRCLSCQSFHPLDTRDCSIYPESSRVDHDIHLMHEAAVKAHLHTCLLHGQTSPPDASCMIFLVDIETIGTSAHPESAMAHGLTVGATAESHPANSAAFLVRINSVSLSNEGL